MDKTSHAHNTSVAHEPQAEAPVKDPWDFADINAKAKQYREVEAMGGASAAASVSIGELRWVGESGSPANQAGRS